ncbi:hypothetical protein, partial [Escherichia coli]|uniref:hypothetical protein n=1 Tax=Escherichia coli TaxID=562 RepID=UPI003CFCED7D
GASSTLTLPGSANVWGSVNLFTGLADTTHTVNIYLGSSSGYQFGISYGSAFTVTGAAPAISTPSAFSGATIYEMAVLVGLNALWGYWTPNN